MHLFQLEQENFWIQFCIPHWKSQWNQLRVFCFVGKDSYVYTWAKMQNPVFFSERKSLHSICIKLKLCLLLWMLLFNDLFDTFSLQSIWDWRLIQNTYGVGRFPFPPHLPSLFRVQRFASVVVWERHIFPHQPVSKVWDFWILVSCFMASCFGE